MKNLFLAVSVFALCFASCKDESKETMETDTTVATDSIVSEEPQTPEPPMDSIAMQKAWEAYMTPGEPHKMMAADVGQWNDELTFWMGPDAPPEKATATEDVKMILGNRYQVATTKGEMMGMPFEGRSTIAYDNATNEYISTWIDNMGTGLSVMRGKYDPASKATTLTGTMVDPMTGNEKQMKQIYTIIDDDTRKMEMFIISEGGEEFKNMEILMKRAK
ncbi:DUF1579 domain-containing protein [Aequorivita sp. F47161]|uniref:DUF1579 domain-containing protein n=1 Tax=Aequorivita vitellina TaxID=2874475 RepID=A0A9X1QZI0_9FLAO|nr:DUF1579 domain-containing protein [Aequorivita vitellina]MCG2420222.1 DUF1579 domain-containing protein [Aequorivita vitellina]MCZ4320275.1 DUF1579 domain-containing protein [Aequorivita viscosa]